MGHTVDVAPVFCIEPEWISPQEAAVFQLPPMARRLAKTPPPYSLKILLAPESQAIPISPVLGVTGRPVALSM